jgi:hypothetical protein
MNTLRTKRVFVLAFTLLLFYFANAQSDYRPGSIITWQNDTVNGLINFKGDKANAKECCFIETEDSKKELYSPDQIKSYQYSDGKYYLSSKALNDKFEIPVFLEYLIKGTISIFYYQDDKKNHYYVVKDTSITELDHHDKLTGVAEEDIAILAKPEKYKFQLKLLVKDQPVLFDKIDKLECNAENLISLTREYQKLQCPNQECIQFEKKTGGNVKLKIGVVSSAGASNLSSPPYDIFVNDYDETKYLNFKTAFSYEIGAMFNLYLDYYGRNKFSLQLTPALNFVRYTSNEEKVLSPLKYVYKLSIDFTSLGMPLLLKYSFYSKNSTVYPFLKFGPVLAICLGQKGNYEYYSVPISGSNQRNEYYKPLNKVTKFVNIYGLVSAGADIKCGKKLLSIGAAYSEGEAQFKGYRSDIKLIFELQF